MDQHTLDCLDFGALRELLGSFTQTSLGRAQSQRIQPSPRRELVQRWFSQVAELQSVQESLGAIPLGGVRDVRDMIDRCAPPVRVSSDEFSELANTIDAANAVRRFLGQLPEDASELRHFLERIGDFSSLEQRIRSLVDERGQVRDSASPKLSSLRQQIDRAQFRIREVVSKLLDDNRVKRLLQYQNHTFCDDRLVLPMRAECRGRIPGIVHGSSDSGATLFVEPAQCVELNNRVLELRVSEQEEIQRLLWELGHEVHMNAAELNRMLSALAILDLIGAKVRFAKLFKAHCPSLSDAATLNLRGARHPLLLDLRRQQAESDDVDWLNQVVPIDVRLGEDFDLLLVTGPNTGGKTIALKTIGLLTLMVQSGVPIPIEKGGHCGVFSRVLIDIGDEQSMQQSLSTFSAHLTHQLRMLQESDRDSLCLIDELGAGTDPDEGAALGRAILDELLTRSAKCVVTSHIGALKAFALDRERAENACVEFNPRTFKPTYRLSIGEPGTSNALAIARRVGVAEHVLTQAEQELKQRGRRLNDVLRSTVRKKREAEKSRKQLDKAKVRADEALTDAQEQRDLLQRQRDDFQRWVQRVVHLQPNDAVRVRGFERDGKVVRVRSNKRDFHLEE